MPPPGAALYVAQNVGELALIVRRAGVHTAPDPATLPLGRIGAAENDGAAVAFVETRVRGKPLGAHGMPLLSGMLCLRGAAVPSLAAEWTGVQRRWRSGG